MTMLYKNGRSFEDIINAAFVLREHVWESWDAMKASVEEDGLDDDETLDEYNTGSTYHPIERQSLRTWEIYSDPSSALEFAPEGWLERLALWKVSKPWNWLEIYAIMALWSVDESIAYVEINSPYKAASWALRASKFLDWSDAEFGGERVGTSDTAARFSAKGIEARHATNREVKKKALQIYASKTWPSKAEAARRISPEINRTELVVLRWIREHHKK